MAGGAMQVRQILRTYSWARGQRWLRTEGMTVSFSAVALVIEAQTGLELGKVRSALAGGFSSKDTLDVLARWNGLRLATRHGAPVLVMGDDVALRQSAQAARGGAVPLAPKEVLARTAQARALAEQRLSGMRGAA